MKRLQTIALMTLFATISVQFFVIYSFFTDHTHPFKARSPSNYDHNSALSRELKARAMLYYRLSESQMLSRGMTVNLNGEGRFVDYCDSLLFSSLRYRSLQLMNMNKQAEQAWSAILASAKNADGDWIRHPKCDRLGLSRDMFMGLMIALESKPENSELILKNLLLQIAKRNGKFSDGPFYLSFLSPGTASLLRGIADQNQIGYSNYPWILKQSFSSIEVDTFFLKPGYESHLAGLGIWLELQLRDGDSSFNPRSFMGEIERRINAGDGLFNEGATQSDQFRLNWVTSKLVNDNPRNLFFRYLYHRARHDLTAQRRMELTSELLAMPQFPPDDLPMDCHKDADYLWQRKDEDYDPTTNICRHRYSGVDFLWMAAMLSSQ
ncbi:MAG: hypothetical protein NT027_02030 [Proteobacteria bacterium]|nr:hypothetical protein [Pseudomonadota bacterium]